MFEVRGLVPGLGVVELKVGDLFPRSCDFSLSINGAIAGFNFRLSHLQYPEHFRVAGYVSPFCSLSTVWRSLGRASTNRGRSVHGPCMAHGRTLILPRVRVRRYYRKDLEMPPTMHCQSLSVSQSRTKKALGSALSHECCHNKYLEFAGIVRLSVVKKEANGETKSRRNHFLNEFEASFPLYCLALKE